MGYRWDDVRPTDPYGPVELVVRVVGFVALMLLAFYAMLVAIPADVAPGPSTTTIVEVER